MHQQTHAPAHGQYVLCYCNETGVLSCLVGPSFTSYVNPAAHLSQQCTTLCVAYWLTGAAMSTASPATPSIPVKDRVSHETLVETVKSQQRSSDIAREG